MVEGKSGLSYLTKEEEYIARFNHKRKSLS